MLKAEAIILSFISTRILLHLNLTIEFLKWLILKEKNHDIRLRLLPSLIYTED
jgi:hypothetical protein